MKHPRFLTILLMAILLAGLLIGTVSANIEGNISVMANFPANSTATDISTMGHVFTPNANVTYNTSSPKFGSAAWEVTNASLCMISGDGSSDFAFNQSDFSISGWLYVRSYGLSSTGVLYDGRPNSGSGAYPYLYLSGNVLVYYVNGAHLIDGTQGITKNTWHYVKLTRIGSYTSLYLDGVNQSLPKYDANDYLIPSGRPYIGMRSTIPFAESGFTGMMDDIGVRKGNGTVSNSTAIPDTEFVNNPKSIISPSATSGTAPLVVAITDTSTGNTAITSHRLFLNNVTGNNTQFIASIATSPTLTLGVGNFSLIGEASNQFGISNSTPIWINVSAATYDHITNLANLTYPRSIRWQWNSSGYNYLYVYWNGALHKTLNTSDLSDYWTDLEPLTNYTFSAYTDTNASWVNRTVQTGYGPTDQYVEIDFDDIHEGIYDNAWPVMSAAGINHANLLVIGNRIEATNSGGVPGPYPHYMSLTNITFLCNDQHWNCTNHQDQHSVSNFDLTPIELYNEFVNCSANLTRYNLIGSQNKMSYRGGGNNESIRAIARAAGMETGRGVAIAPSRQLPNYSQIWNLTVTDTASDSHTPERIENEILAGLTGHNQTATITFHEVSDTYNLTDGTTYPIGNFTILMNWIRDHGYKVITVNEWYALDGASPPIPVANFTANTTTVLVGEPILFTDTSTNETIAWNWTFGDGTYQYVPMNLTKIYALNTTSPGVEHSYASPGTYTVSLNASSGFGYSITSQILMISANVTPTPTPTVTPTPTTSKTCPIPAGDLGTIGLWLLIPAVFIGAICAVILIGAKNTSSSDLITAIFMTAVLLSVLIGLFFSLNC